MSVSSVNSVLSVRIHLKSMVFEKFEDSFSLNVDGESSLCRPTRIK